MSEKGNASRPIMSPEFSYIYAFDTAIESTKVL